MVNITTGIERGINSLPDKGGNNTSQITGETLDTINSTLEGNNNNTLNEQQLETNAKKSLKDAFWLIREAVALERLKTTDSEYFDKRYNGSTDERGYLYDVDGNQTGFLASQIDSDGGSHNRDLQQTRDIIQGTKNINIENISAQILLKKGEEEAENGKWLLRESIALERLKTTDSEYFDKHYNGSTDERGYLYDVDGNQTGFLASQIDSDGGSHNRDLQQTQDSLITYLQELR